MNITQETIAPLTREIRVEIQPEDFRPRVIDAIKKQGKKIQLPGFRPGMVPMGMMKKMLGKSVMAEELNQLLRDALNDFITNESLRILGEPLPKNTLDEDLLDPDTEKILEFSYEIGISPDIEIDFSAGTPILHYEVEVDEDFYTAKVEEQLSYHGEYQNTEVCEKGDTLIGYLAQLDASGEIDPESKSFLVLSPRRIREEVLARFEGKRLEDRVPFNVFEVEPNEENLSSLFYLQPEDIEAIRGKETFFVIERIGHSIPAKPDEAFFRKVLRLQADEPIDEESFKERFSESIQKEVSWQARVAFSDQLEAWLLENVNFELPDAFLKKYLQAGDEKLTEESVEQNYPDYARNIRLQIIYGHLRRKYPEQADVDTDSFHAALLSRYGYEPSPERSPEEEQAIRQAWLKEIFKQEESVNSIYNTLLQSRITDFMMSQVNMETRKLSATEFFEVAKAKK